MLPLKMRAYRASSPSLVCCGSLASSFSGNGKNGSDGVPFISLADKPSRLTMPTRPARDSFTSFMV